MLPGRLDDLGTRRQALPGEAAGGEKCGSISVRAQGEQCKGRSKMNPVEKIEVDGPEGYGADQNADDHAHESRPSGVVVSENVPQFSIERFCGKRLEDIDVSQLPLGLHDRSGDPVMICARQYDRNGRNISVRPDQSDEIGTGNGIHVQVCHQ